MNVKRNEEVLYTITLTDDEAGYLLDYFSEANTHEKTIRKAVEVAEKLQLDLNREFFRLGWDK